MVQAYPVSRKFRKTFDSGLVRERGFEPLCLSAPDPKSGASPDSATLARANAGKISYAIRAKDTIIKAGSEFGKNGIHLSAALLKSYGFNSCDSFKLFAPEAGKIMLEKI